MKISGRSCIFYIADQHLQLSSTDYGFILLPIAAVIGLEIMNVALERLCNHVFKIIIFDENYKRCSRIKSCRIAHTPQSSCKLLKFKIKIKEEIKYSGTSE